MALTSSLDSKSGSSHKGHLMASVIELLKRLEQSKDVFWQGAVSDSEITRLESLLGCHLPASFRQFLRICGGGGITRRWISGIEDGNASNENRGTVYGDTLRCREDSALPAQLVVIYFTDDHVIWCLDTSLFANDDCPVVSFDEFTGSIDPLFPSFESFLESYANRRLRK